MQSTVQKIVILGTGYGELAAALRLARKGQKQPIEVTLVNASETFRERVRLHQLAASLKHLP